MSTNAVQIVAEPEAFQESLAERMAFRPLSLVEALRYATEIARTLRDLHDQGLAYGAVSSQLILLGPSGATLQNTGGLKRLGEGRYDVAAFGAVLGEMIRGEQSAEVRDSLREEARVLAARCAQESPDMKQVLICLRLLGLKARQAASVGLRMPRPILVQRTTAPVSKRHAMKTVRVRLHVALQWKPLANLAAFALSGK